MNIVLIIFLSFLGCNTPKVNNETIVNLSDSTKPNTQENISSQNSQTQSIDIGYNNLKLIGELHKKQRQVSSKEIQNSGCEGWVFKESSLEGLLKKMKKVEPVEWNMLCYDYPCYYEGKVSNGAKEYTITINAASFVKLTNDSETIIFINTKESLIFLTPCNCCE